MATLFGGCSSTKFVPQDRYLLGKVIVKGAPKEMPSSSLESYLKQEPNFKLLGLWRVPLHIYNFSGRDSTKWYNQFVRKIGEAPVVYDSLLQERSNNDLKRVLQNAGFLDAEVTSDARYKKREAIVRYDVVPGKLYLLDSICYHIPDSLKRLIGRQFKPELTQRTPFNLDRLEKERSTLTSVIRNRGFYEMNKNMITCEVDTTHGSDRVRMEILLDTTKLHRYKIGEIYINLNFDPSVLQSSSAVDTLSYRSLKFYNTQPDWIKHFLIADQLRIRPGGYFSDLMNDLTYTRITRLRCVKYCSIRYMANPNDSTTLDCHIAISPSKAQTFGAEVEGTNSSGDFGAALAFNYQHNNLFKSAEVFNAKLRGAYEYLGGEGESNYIEFSAEAGFIFPRILFPFINTDYLKRLNATSELTFNTNFQSRPEYTRLIFGGGWRYKWQQGTSSRFSFDLADISYTYLPYKSDEFREIYEDGAVDPLLRLSYEDIFILRSGITYYKTNQTQTESRRTNIYSLRTNIEIAGNLLYGIGNLFSLPLYDGGYHIMGIRFAQYVRAEFDYAFRHKVGTITEFAYHISAGVAYPYGNLGIIPFEKRFFAGGANNNRGWSVRGLGPGIYQSKASQTDYINQSGDIKLSMNFEYRTLLFWKLYGALFIDAGNIWTIKEYQGQEGGLFKWNEFYKQIAVSYGAGIRVDFSFLVFRLDLGVKLFDPSRISSEQFRLTQHHSSDLTLHFAIGYPF